MVNVHDLILIWLVAPVSAVLPILDPITSLALRVFTTLPETWCSDKSKLQLSWRPCLNDPEKNNQCAWPGLGYWRDS